ncbi:haloacid dehalogenase type II [Halobacillus sp. Marseille-P3879]|uniref:haloacid dehalogenase type II n=1 Tax=Halobacillus sp. Marseille-P3879 TaxID=2045014 RepID=UPI000C79AC5E|nr:haloacid dehalogenase type II [Halobacillus sp. Marseille-P3879]
MSYKAFVFDAYGTLFDVHSVAEGLHNQFPEKGDHISQAWRSNQVHYFMVRQLIGGYVPFNKVTSWALHDALIKNGISPDQGTIASLMEEYEKLSPYEEVHSLKENYPHLELTIFSNGTRSMLKPLLINNNLSRSFTLLSADDVRVYKPQPAAYEYAASQLNVNKDEVLFFSSNPWDIAGAGQYGFHTAWVNREKQAWPSIGLEPDYILQNLKEIPGQH